jgi:galactonate dehydratase
VTRGGGSQVAEAAHGLAILRHLRAAYPRLDLCVDCHGRFTPEAFLMIRAELEALKLYWIEEPCPIGDAYAQIRKGLATPVAAGELYFGPEAFADLASKRWADVVMPDVKHVGGFGPLLGVCARMARHGVQVSPHNPSGTVSTLASLHAAAVSPAVTSVEIPLRSGGAAPPCRELLQDGAMRIPTGPGWGWP